ncbi:FkbM family methyltransferase [Chloroflexota bacterium]
MKKIARKISQRYRKMRNIDQASGIKIHTQPDLQKLGTNYGGWVIPSSILNENSICYCAGVGEDISFDLALIKNYGCPVYAFDPTPRSKTYVDQNAAGIAEFHFHPSGIWDENTTLKFFSPQNSEHVSHSIGNLQNTSDYFEAPCKTIPTLMQELGHTHIELLKMDIEGAEYQVIDSIIKDDLCIKCLCVEFHYKPNNTHQLRQAVNSLIKCNYKLISVDNYFNYTFLK